MLFLGIAGDSMLRGLSSALQKTSSRTLSVTISASLDYPGL